MSKLVLLALYLILIILIAGCTQQPTGQAIQQTTSCTFPITNVKEINENPESSVGKCVEIKGLVTDTFKNNEWFELTGDLRFFQRNTVDEWQLIDVHNTPNFDFSNIQLETPIIVKGIDQGSDLSPDCDYGVVGSCKYIEATEIKVA
jgi:hypothetical protein